MPTTKGPTEGEAFASIRRKLEQAVSRTCPYLAASDKDDVVQAAALRLVRIQQKSEGDRHFKASYLWRVAYSTLIDEIRKQRRRNEELLDPEVLDTTFHSPGNPEQETAARQMGSAIQSCLQTLIRDRRLAVTLYLQGHGVPEAARLLDWERKKVENLVYRGLADLRRCLDSKGIKP